MSIRIVKKTCNVLTFDKDVEQLEFSHIAGGNSKW